MKKMSNSKIKAGVIVEDRYVSYEIFNFLTHSNHSDDYEVVLIAVHGLVSRNNFFSRIKKIFRKFQKYGFIKNILFKVIIRFERFVIGRFLVYKNFTKKFDISNFGIEIYELTPIFSDSGLSCRYSPDDLSTLRDLGVELVVRDASGILRGQALTAFEYGVLSFHHGDNRVNRGGPPGFWEVADQAEKTGFILQRLTEDLDGGQVLYRGSCPTSWCCSLNLIRVRAVAEPALYHVIKQFRKGGGSWDAAENGIYSHPLYSTPSVYHQIRYVLGVTKSVLVKIFRRLSGRQLVWNVAYQFTGDWKNSSLWRSSVIPNPRGRYFADPFVIEKDGKHYCFVEDFDRESKQGSISVLAIEKDRPQFVGKCLEEDFHLSYPFIFKYDDGYYMIPETHQARAVRLYKCLNWPLQWVFVRELIKDVSAADINIFKGGQTWWLFANIATGELNEHSSELHAFFSADPISGNWRPHGNNPIVSDSSLARNGGLIIEKGTTFRVRQRQDFDFYGRSLSIAEVKEISDTRYEEKEIMRITANMYDRIKGVHTFNYTNGLIVFDFVN